LTRSEVHRQLAIEQKHLTALYARVDALRAEAATRLAAARDAGPDRDATAFWQAELIRLESAEDGLCFGRLDMRDGRRVYVGRMGVFRDEDDEPLLVDWRASEARPFYTATMATAQGVRRRRRITTRARLVVALDDELLDQDPADAGALVGEAALLAALTTDRTGRMRDIVTTLQAEQDRIVRDPYPGALVVQGGPGTGKTAVALHRLAYLLYTRAHLRTRGVLIVGPSQVFLDYIGLSGPAANHRGAVLPPWPTCPTSSPTLSPGEAKGLEFDSVLIVDPAAMLTAPLGHNDLYVAMTRATRQLGIVHLGPPPAELSGIQQRTA
jgi:DNA helicase IV